MQSIGILGGTFDPIHYGHIRLAIEVYDKLELDELKLIPANIPPHRSTTLASANDRKKMIELAISDQENLSIDLREIENKNISYTVNTLISIRSEFPTDALFLIVGEDVFDTIDSWKDWQSLLNYSHIIVATRPKNYKKNISDDVKKITSMSDYILIASGNSRRQVNALADKLIQTVKENKFETLGVEGKAEGEWVLVDLGDIVVHIMHPNSREYYQLEKLWGK